ncbi:MAG: LTA synthase family protein [Bacteroidota bacterium]|nr:LTA synthase family protein [Bacteroidota bacterium]
MTFVLFLLLLLGVGITLFIIIPKKIKLSAPFAFALTGVFVLASIASISSITYKWKPGPEFSNSISLNKSYFFYTRCYKSLYGNKNENISRDSNKQSDVNAFHYVDEAHYPFLHTVDSVDVLSPFFNKTATPPNIVFIVVEGLGRAFSNKDAYLGSFTPFLDSLSDKSLYWSNFLSEGGRTFAMLPSIYGSLPFSKNGFLELGDQMPAHLSMINILNNNGYKSNFFYGGDASFDNMDKFLKMDGAGVYDEKTFPAGYSKMPSSSSGFTWGYGDEELLERVNEVSQNEASPKFNMVMTLSTHSPFLLAHQDKYLQMFEQRMQTLQFTDDQKKEHRLYDHQYASILYCDEAIRNFMTSYAQRADFSNTIFVFTGDHRMPEIPMSTKIDRYHVPLIIYSPLLKRGQTFAAMSTHFDIAPSMLALLKNTYNLKVPAVATWMGTGLDTAHEFRNIHAYPFIQTKTDMLDYVMDEYMLHGDDLFKISNNMGLDPVENDAEKTKLKNAFNRFKQKNNQLANTKSMLPDSLLVK